MDEPTEEQLKQLRKDIMSGFVMVVEVEHYKRLTDNLDKSYDANKEQAERIKKLEAYLISIRKSTEIMEARRFAEQALEGGK